MHLVVQKITDFSAELASAGNRKSVFPLPHGRGDEARYGSGPDPRERPHKGLRARDFVDPYGHIDELRVKSRNFHELVVSSVRPIRFGIDDRLVRPNDGA